MTDDINKIFPLMEEKDEELNGVEEILGYLEGLAESYPYLDGDYQILVLECSKKPIIIMSPDEFIKLQRKILGETENGN